MRIALATWFPADPEVPAGGVEAVSVNLALGLSAIHDNEVHVVTFDRAAREPGTGEWKGITIHRLPLLSGSLLGFAKGAGRRALREYLLKLAPEVVHAHDTFGIMTRYLDLPRVFTIHGFVHEDTRYHGGWKSRFRARMWKREETAVWAEQPHIVSISPYVRERLRGISNGTVHDIENPIDRACFDIVREEASGTVFSAAVIAPRKNPLGLASAFATIPLESGTKLKIAGPVTDVGYGCELDKYIRETDAAERVQLLGNLTSPQVREELGRAAVFALVSYEEGAPMGVAEAMAAGVPVLTSNRCGMPYMVCHGETGFLVDPHDKDDIGRHLKLLLEDHGIRKTMGEAAKKIALTRHHPDVVARRTMRVYERAISDFRK